MSERTAASNGAAGETVPAGGNGTAGSNGTADGTVPANGTVPAGGTDTAGGTGIGLCGIDHVGVAVADLDQAIEFYQSVFGMRCVHMEENAAQGVREAMMSFGPGGPDAVGGAVQLLAPLSPASPIARFLDRSGPGIQQVAYRVTDLDATCAELLSRGVRLLYQGAQRGTAGSRVNFVNPRDAGGVLVELVEPGQPPAA